MGEGGARSGRSRVRMRHGQKIERTSASVSTRGHGRPVLEGGSLPVSTSAESRPEAEVGLLPRRRGSRRAAQPVAVPTPDPRGRGTRARWSGVARSARTRILATYFILLAVSALLSTFAIRQILLIRLDDRIADAGQQEVAELERLLYVGKDPETGKPFRHPAALFDAYLQRNVPSSEEALITFVDGTHHKSSLQRFPLSSLPAEVYADWAALSSKLPGKGERVTGTFETELGKSYYRVRRVELEGHNGAFVVAILPAAELEEIQDLQTYGAIVIVGVLLIASAFAWLVAGRALAPVRLLTETARSISQSDLTRRIPMYGAGDAAEMARSFNAMLDRLEAVFRSHRAFVQDASHELRDPLTICRGHLELLSDDPDDQRKTVALVLDELDRMGRIVDDLQLLAEAEQPDFLRPEAVDLGTFAHELVAKAGALGARSWRLDETAEGTIVADRHRLTEAVMNLAHNAVQHTTQDDTIAVGTSLDDHEGRLWVRDTGAGIQVSDQARIFDRFTRGRDAYRRYRGGGLGLAIVKAIAEAHGGRVEVESDLGIGSKFTIILPRDASEGSDWPES
jgi:two-component system, OmpR family, sensor kinase